VHLGAMATSLGVPVTSLGVQATSLGVPTTCLGVPARSLGALRITVEQAGENIFRNATGAPGIHSNYLPSNTC